MTITLKDIIGLTKELPESYFEEAFEKLKALKERADSEKETESVTCIRCGSTSVVRNGKRNRLGRITEFKVGSVNMQRVLVVGSIMNDLVLQVERMPKPGESYLGNGYSVVNGGKGANQAVAVARLGADVTFVGKVGNDADGERLKKALESEKIDITQLKSTLDSPTGLAVIMVEKGGQNRIIVNPGANMNLTIDDIEEAYQDDYDLVIMQLEMQHDIVKAVYEGAKKKSIPTVLDVGPAQSFQLESLKGIEIISPNETEAYALTGIEINCQNDAENAAAKLKEISEAKYIVMKLGKQGALLYDGKDFDFFPAHSVDVRDTTAAGDAFTAAMALDHIRSKDIRRAVEYGNIAGALAVTKIGAQPLMPCENEMEDFIRIRSSERKYRCSR